MHSAPMPTRVLSHFATHRITWSRVIAVVTIFLALFSAPPKYMHAWLLDVFELTGYALLCAATLWRVWCITFIGGSKDGELAVLGPYSVVRNPLYVGSFLGVVGFGLAMSLPVLALMLAMTFGVLYPAVVAQEEVRLAALFGKEYEKYCERVPRWLPRWSAYEEPVTVVVVSAKVRQGLLDGMWYLWAFAFVELVEVLHEHGVLPYLF